MLLQTKFYRCKSCSSSHFVSEDKFRLIESDEGFPIDGKKYSQELVSVILKCSICNTIALDTDGI